MKISERWSTDSDPYSLIGGSSLKLVPFSRCLTDDKNRRSRKKKLYFESKLQKSGKRNWTEALNLRAWFEMNNDRESWFRIEKNQNWRIFCGLRTPSLFHCSSVIPTVFRASPFTTRRIWAYPWPPYFSKRCFVWISCPIRSLSSKPLSIKC